ncbi:hypothetical protein HI914_06710 [Erysiphe necator]|nr:hypothetical protein HI914_06710 [Erysiphe necator]
METFFVADIKRSFKKAYYSCSQREICSSAINRAESSRENLTTLEEACSFTPENGSHGWWPRSDSCNR